MALYVTDIENKICLLSNCQRIGDGNDAKGKRKAGLCWPFSDAVKIRGLSFMLYVMYV